MISPKIKQTEENSQFQVFFRHRLILEGQTPVTLHQNLKPQDTFFYQCKHTFFFMIFTYIFFHLWNFDEQSKTEKAIKIATSYAIRSALFQSQKNLHFRNFQTSVRKTYCQK